MASAGWMGRPPPSPRFRDSLRWLHTDHTDLYYLRRLDQKVPIEESVVALARAIEAGNIG